MKASKKIKLEVLAPAKNATIAIEAIKHGADAVYMGANRYGARAMAGNSIEDISRVVDFAHKFNAKVYITINTILYDNELNEVEKLIHQLYKIGVDALTCQTFFDGASVAACDETGGNAVAAHFCECF